MCHIIVYPTFLMWHHENALKTWLVGWSDGAMTKCLWPSNVGDLEIQYQDFPDHMMKHFFCVCQWTHLNYVITGFC